MEKVVRPEEDRTIILALPYDRRLPDATGILNQHYKLLVQRNPEVKEWMMRAPMVAHLRPANLRDFLVRAKLPQLNRRQGSSRGCQPGFRKCGKARCLCCIYSANSKTHTSTLTGQTWPIKQSITCDDHSVVYNVTCSHQAGQCLRRPAQYVGKVGATRACRVRCTEHRGAARNHWDTGVGEHFNLPGHEVADFNFLPFEKIRSSDPFVLEARESFWIEKYGVLGEGGMNRRS